MIDYGKRELLNVMIDAVDMETAVDRIYYFARHRRPCSVTALAVHGIVEASRDPRLVAALNDFDVVVPDGQPVRWALNGLYGLDLPDKIPGPSLVDMLLMRAAEDGYPVHFHGSTQTTLNLMGEELRRRFRGRLSFTSSASLFRGIDHQELDCLIASINATGAQLCFIGLGCPRQERFVAAAAGRLEMPSLAVGAAFDYIAGNINRAPAWLQRSGLEWTYRLVQEPRRLAGRYVGTNSAFIAGVARQAWRDKLRKAEQGAPTEADTAVPWATIDA
jgi:exopolysaccharide biosynthesis WecB/TagA/CpsF family protein